MNKSDNFIIIQKGEEISILTLYINFSSAPEEDRKWISDIPSLVVTFYKIPWANKFEIGQKKCINKNKK